MSHTRMTTLTFIISELFLLDCLRCSLSAPKIENPLVYYRDTLRLCRTGQDDVSRTRMTTLTFILFDYFSLMVSDEILCALLNLNALWCIIIILYSYNKQVLTTCGVQERQLSPLYFLSYLHLMVKATMSFISNTVRNTFMRLYGSVEEVMTMCRV